MVTRWTFYDGSTTETFELNPQSGGSPKLSRNVIGTPTVAPDGTVLFFEGQPKPRTSSFTGVIRFESEYDFFESWIEKEVPIVVTDDLGRSFTIRITDWTPERVRSALHPWKHNYTAEYIILAS